MPLLDRSSELARHLLVCGAALWNALGTRTETSARPWQGHWNLNLTMTLVSGLSCRVSLGTQTGSCESRMRSLATASARSNHEMIVATLFSELRHSNLWPGTARYTTDLWSR